ncbi:MAG: ABC transporter substrate-binding protein [Polyangiales bacterium]
MSEDTLCIRLAPPSARRPQLQALRACFLAFACITAACGKHAAQPNNAADNSGYETLELRYQGSASGVVYPELAEDLGFLAPLKLQHLGTTFSGPQDIQSVATNQTDFGLAFNGAIAKMVASKAPIRSVVGVYNVDEVTWNGLWVLESSNIRSPRDFIGKKVAMNTLGAHSEFVLREYLARGGLTPQEIAQVTLLVFPPVSAEQALRSGQVDAVHFLWLTQDVALEKGGLHRIVSDYDLFGAFNAASYVLSDRFIREKPKAARKLVEGIAKAIEWGRTTPREEVIARLERIMQTRKRHETTAMLKHWKPAGKHTQGGLLTERDFDIWIDWLVKDGKLTQGQVAARDVFTNSLNPYAK